jgi:hypothetical protein
MTVPSGKPDSANASGLNSPSGSGLLAAAASQPANIPFDVSLISQYASQQSSSSFLATHSHAPVSNSQTPSALAMPQTSQSLGQLPAIPISTDRSFNFHQQLVVLHAQALVLTDAVSRTQQFLQHQKLQKKPKSKQAKDQDQKQLDQLIEHQQRQQQQFLVMLQRQQETMQQNQQHVSFQQHQQQQAQFFIYKQLMDNLLRTSQQMGIPPDWHPATVPESTADVTAQRMSQMQSFMFQQQSGQLQGILLVASIHLNTATFWH